ncbi:MAG: hypothetical protein P2A85_09175 [Microcoleus anatoxicus]|uniref:hypothetical protein n=1 Tax=Microcoleus anatoxicus TaxID=2705319 RepID=UPI0036712B01
MTKSVTSASIIRAEFLRKREQLIREKELDITLEKRHQGLDDFSKGDMKPFVKSVKIKLKKARKGNLIK